MNQKKRTEKMESTGVQALIDRLQADGINAGQERGERIIADAEKRAEWLLKQAREEADSIREKAKKDADFIQTSGREALAMAIRDSQLYLKNYLTGAFAAEINQLVADALKQDDLLEKMILEIAGKARPNDNAVRILLSSDTDPRIDKLDSDVTAALKRFVSFHAKEMLERGVDIEISENPAACIRIFMTEANAEVELSANSVSQLILQTIQPRFKTLLDGLLT
ncbi:MAG: hypothetical protein MI976_09990 [Pseudomonadales bacterium]|nr:hypothetical protein [Pseudomonadales bacterium]